MSSLRTSLIRLAHENPGLRQHLLPVLKEAAPDPRQNLINALIGELKRDSGGHIKKDLIERAEKYAEGHFDCDDLMDRSDRELINPSIDMDRVLDAGEWENWLLKIARANPKVGALVKSYLALRDSQGVRGDDALSELVDGPVEVYFSRIQGDSVEGWDLEGIYDAMRENCAEADEEASDPYGSRGLRQRDFYASSKTAADKLDFLSLGIANRLAEIITSVDDDELVHIPVKLTGILNAVKLMQSELKVNPTRSKDLVGALSSALTRRLKLFL